MITNKTSKKIIIIIIFMITTEYNLIKKLGEKYSYLCIQSLKLHKHDSQ